MSSQTYISGSQYETAVVHSDIPASSCSSLMMKPVSTIHKIIKCVSQDGVGQLGGVSTINIARTSDTSIKRGSAMLRVRMDFQIPIVAGAAKTFQFSNAIRGASSAIQQLTLSSNSTELERFTYYSDLHALMLIHASNNAYLQSDAKAYEYCANVFQCPINIAQTVKSVYVNIPLISGVLGNSDQDFPLYMAPLTLQIGWVSSLAQIVSESVNSQAVSGVTFNEVELVYESVQHNNTFVEAQRSLVQSGQTFNLGYKSAMSLIKSSEANLYYPIGCGKMSVNALLYTNYQPQALGDFRVFKSNTQTDCTLLLDGIPVNTFGALNIQKCAPSVYVEMKRSLGALLDTSVCSSGSSITMITGDQVVAGSYLDTNFMGGFSLKRTDEAGYTFSGTPVQTMHIALTSTPAGGDITQFHILYDSVASFDGMGNVLKIC